MGQSVELRKARKDEQLTKRRNIDTDELDASPISPLSDSKNVAHAAPVVVVNEQTLKQLVDDLFR